jgi:hypothetical protein
MARRVILLASLLASVFVALSIGWARGVPSTQALTYSGTLLAPSGEALSGTRNIEVKLWASGTEGEDPLCTTGSQALELEAGRFTLSLPEACVAAVSEHADAWLDVLVDGASLGRTKLGAVPYAIEAAHAQLAEAAKRSESAARADGADNADRAKEADHATTADTATSADSAARATTAESADRAAQSDSAVRADTAARADSAANADSASSTFQQADGVHSYRMQWVNDHVLHFIVDTSHVKTFIIDHPIDRDRYLIHTTLEGPENAVFYRGSSHLEAGVAEIALPSYFEAATRLDGRTVQLTPRFHGDREPVSMLAASAVENGRFRVRAVDGRNAEQAFDWEVKAVRADVQPLWVEPQRTQIEVHGDGPYKYFSTVAH